MSSLLDGVNASALGLMAAVTVQLGAASLRDLYTVAIASISVILLFRYKINSTWLIAGGALAGFFISFLSSTGRITRKVFMNVPLLTQQQGSVLQVTLNRPEAFNALNLDMMNRLAEILASAATDRSIKSLLLTGNGKAFCAGGDLKWISQQTQEAGSVLYGLAPQFHLSITEIRRMEKPVVAAINGIAAGGGFSLALACDFRVMAESAILRQAYTSSGLSIDGGGSFALPRLVGLARAMEIMAFDHPISSVQALEWGLVTRVVPDGEAVSAAFAILNDLAKTALHSFAWSKKLMTNSFNNTLETQLEWERQGISECAAHPNGQEGIKAFVEKRKPSF
jgi:2-(1,2-epoxy-1,2-dihydrophenyl)acetyl-CoA isomerase